MYVESKGERVIGKTPDMRTRIIAALKNIFEDVNNKELTDQEASEKYAVLLELARNIRGEMLSNRVIDSSNFSSINKDHQLYYSLILESLANDRDIPIYRCEDQWASRLLLTQVLKNKSDSEKKKEEKKVSEVMLSVGKKAYHLINFFFIQYK